MGEFACLGSAAGSLEEVEAAVRGESGESALFAEVTFSVRAETRMIIIPRSGIISGSDDIIFIVVVGCARHF